MKIKNKVFSIIAVVFLLLLIISSLISFQIILKSFNRLENEKIDNGISLLARTVDSEIDNLNSVNGDWAPWDDTYDFVRGSNDSYVETNLDSSTLDNLRVSAMLFFDTGNELVYDATDLPEDQDFRNSYSGMIAYIEANSLFYDASDPRTPVSGMIIVDKLPVFISSWPITDSSEESEVAGRLVMFRFLDAAEIGYIESLLGQKITLYNSIAESDNDARLASSGLTDNKKAILMLSGSEAASYLAVSDLTGGQTLIIEQKLPRSIYQRGRASVLFSIATFIALLFLIGIVTLVVFNRVVLKRILKLSTELEKIASSGNFSERVSKDGSDEVSLLQDNINSTLSSLESELEQRKKSERQLHEKGLALQKTNKELEKTLEDFYTVRIGMYEDMEKGEMEKKNKEIKDRLDELKIKTD